MPSFPQTIQETIAEHTVAVARFEEACSETIAAMAQGCIDALESGGKVCFFGNGGSAADAQHYAAEFVVRFTRNRKGLPAISFTTDTSILTACANDFGYESVFARQIEALCEKNDVVVGISTSGSSANVVKALEFAQLQGISTFAFTGENGGGCGEAADLCLAVPSLVTARVQECHLIAGHLICDLVEAHFADSQ